MSGLLSIKKINLLFCLVLLYFCIPKIDLFMIPGTLTGFRFQDIISACVFFLLLNGSVKPNSVKLLILLVLHALYSILFWENFQSALGIIRFIEYYAIALGLCYLARAGMFPKFLKVSFFYLAVLSILQFLLLVPNVDPGRGLVISHEFSGSFGTPAELSYFIVTSLFLLSIVDRKLSGYSFLSIAVLLNGVKAPALSFVVLYWDILKKINAIAALFLFVIMCIFIYIVRENIFLGSQMLDIVVTNITTANAGFDDLKSGSSMMSESSGTLSHRIGKWTNSLSLMYQHPLGLLFGFGIYSQGGAVDGGILRFVYEFGLIVSIIMIQKLNKLSFVFLLFVLSVNLLFDAFMSSVVMPLLITAFICLLDKKNRQETS